MFTTPRVSQSVPSSPILLQLPRNYKLFPISNILHIIYPLLRELFIPPQLGNLRLSVKIELQIHRLRRLSLTTNLHENHCSLFFCFRTLFTIYSYIYFIYLLAMSCSLWELSYLTNDWTQALSRESGESQPLDSQGILHLLFNAPHECNWMWSGILYTTYFPVRMGASTVPGT